MPARLHDYDYVLHYDAATDLLYDDDGRAYTLAPGHLQRAPYWDRPPVAAT